MSVYRKKFFRRFHSVLGSGEKRLKTAVKRFFCTEKCNSKRFWLLEKEAKCISANFTPHYWMPKHPPKKFWSQNIQYGPHNTGRSNLRIQRRRARVPPAAGRLLPRPFNASPVITQLKLHAALRVRGVVAKTCGRWSKGRGFEETVGFFLFANFYNRLEAS